MIACFTHLKTNSIPIHALTKDELESYCTKQTPFVVNFIKSRDFKAPNNEVCLIPSVDGKLEKVLLGVQNKNDMWPYGSLPMKLPEGAYHLEEKHDADFSKKIAIAWGMGAYQFDRYKNSKRKPAQLVVEKHLTDILNTVEACYWVRDLINIPAEDMGPEQLALAAHALAIEYQASSSEIIDKDLLEKNYPAIYAVGRAALQKPRLVDLRWGTGKFKLTLVGKGVCFDTGGLHLKMGNNMNLMKKDMGGAAHALGFARMIMQAKLPIQLRVLLPIVENAISGESYRPGDIIQTRKGLTVEITNTDAEGRVILSDALYEASSEKPDLLIDFATLTGAARVALGADLPAMFTSDLQLARTLQDVGAAAQDPVWPMPLFEGYQPSLESAFADLNNCPEGGYGGAITAALFLQKFVPEGQPWVHFDLMAYNLKTTPGHPQGAEMMILRGLFEYVVGLVRT